MNAGDLLDYRSILMVKMRNLPERRHVLQPQLNEAFELGFISKLFREIEAKLEEVNEQAWHANEMIYQILFDPEAGTEQWMQDQARAREAILAFKRSVELNKERVRLKNEANALVGAPKEEKSWNSSTTTR